MGCPGTDAVRAVVDWKWRSFGRAILKVELLIHMITLVLVIIISSILHNPRSGFYHDSRLPSRGDPPNNLDHTIIDYYTQPPSTLMVNVFNFCLALLLGRVLFYEVLNFWNAGTFRQWSSTVWSWVRHEGRRTSSTPHPSASLPRTGLACMIRAPRLPSPSPPK